MFAKTYLRNATLNQIWTLYLHAFESRWLHAPLTFFDQIRCPPCFTCDTLDLHQHSTSYLDPCENGWLLAPFPISRSDPIFAMFYMNQTTSPSKLNFESRSVRKSVITLTLCYFSVRSEVRHVLHETRYTWTKNEHQTSIRSKIGDYSHHFRFLGPIRFTPCFTWTRLLLHEKWTLNLDRFESRWLLTPFAVSRSARIPRSSKSENTKSHSLACFPRHFVAFRESSPRFSKVN